MKKIPSLGEQEMEVLRFVSEKEPVTVRDVAQYFEVEKKLARTTVLTVMERLRKKGFLSRQKDLGVFVYSAKFQTRDVLTSKVTDFVQKTLGGSVSPLLRYFLDSKQLSKDEVEQLKALVAKFEDGNGESI